VFWLAGRSKGERSGESGSWRMIAVEEEKPIKPHAVIADGATLVNRCNKKFCGRVLAVGRP